MIPKQLERVLREGLTIHVEKIIEKEGFTKRIIIANQFDEVGSKCIGTIRK